MRIGDALYFNIAVMLPTRGMRRFTLRLRPDERVSNGRHYGPLACAADGSAGGRLPYLPWHAEHHQQVRLLHEI